MRKKLLRLLRLVPIALAFAASLASAQTTGVIIGVVTDAATGKPVVGALVVATSPNLQGEQTAVTDANGNYRLTVLPPGQYKLAVQLEGWKPAERSDILLRVDKTLRADVAVVPEAVELEEQVVKTGMAPVINLGTAETGSVISKEFMASIPVTRGFEGTAVTTPSAQVDLYGISFSGATSPENSYILDGMRVSDPTYGVLGTNILNNFVEQLDVKTGSFMPEYGHSSAGIVNVVTKSGSNEYHGSVWGNLQPGALTPSSPATGRLGEAIASRPVPYRGGYDADFGFEVGGPIMKDKLWFYAGFAPVMGYQPQDRFLQKIFDDGTGNPVQVNGLPKTEKLPRSDTYYANSYTTYQVLGKLTYLFNEDHNLAASFVATPTSAENRNTLFGDGPNGNVSATQANFDTNSTDLIARYSGRALDKRLLIEASGGWHRQSYKDTPKTLEGIDTGTAPSIGWPDAHPLAFFDNPAGGYPNNNAVALGCSPVGSAFDNCPVVNYFTGGYNGVDDRTADRFAGRGAVSGLFEAAGSHNLKAGIDVEYTAFNDTRFFSGGAAWLAYGDVIQMFRAYGTAPGNVTFVPGIFKSKSDSLQMGYFLQDSWTILNQVTANFGVRWETQRMTSPSSPVSPTLAINDMIAPRVQAIWDFTGTGRGKVQASWGRFYESIPLDIANRAFGSEVFVFGARRLSTCAAGPGIQFNGANPLTACPDVYGLAPGLPPIGSVSGNVPYSLFSSTEPVDPNLKGQYVDMFGGAVEYEVLTDMSVGVEYQGRRLGDIVEDMSSDPGFHSFIANPTVSKPFTSDGFVYDSRRGLSLDPVTNMYFMAVFPEPIRRYDGLTVKLTKNLSNRWLAQASYTYSSFRGNYPGLFRSENGQLDPNWTSEYDLATLLGNKYGPLASDRPHQVKLYGSYNYDILPKVNVVGGVGFNAQSGTPQGALGAHPLYGPGQAYIIPRGMAGRLPWLVNLDLHGEVGYAISAPYAVKFTVDVFNVLNQTAVQYIDQNYTFDTVQPMQAAQCSSKNSVSKSNPIQALQNDCPDIRYLKTVDGRPANVNGNYGRAAPGPAALYNISAPGYQTPIRVRFGLALTF